MAVMQAAASSPAGAGAGGSAGAECRGALAVLEAALQAWAELDPNGFSVAESSVEARLHSVAFRTPGAARSSRHAELVIDLFVPTCSKDGLSVFQKMLRPRKGEVHFLNFWRAFGEAARILGNIDQGHFTVEPSPDLGEALADELELLRDSLLRLPCFDEPDAVPPPPWLVAHMEREAQDDVPPPPWTSAPTAEDALPVAEAEAPAPAAPAVDISEVLRAVRGTAQMSCAPSFWSSVEAALQASPKKPPEYSLDDLATLLLRWLHEGMAWERAAATATVSEPRPRSAPSRSSRLRRGSAPALPAVEREPKGMPVYLHIYDVSHQDQIRKLNKVLAHKRSPLKFGGVFHAGLEVNGLEWSFGMSLDESVPGISCSLPRQHPQHRYRQTIQLRDTRLEPAEVAELISEMIEEYPGDDYDLLRRNCCHFAQDFAKRLGCGPMPGWVHRLAKVGAMVDGAMQLVANRKLINCDEIQE